MCAVLEMGDVLDLVPGDGRQRNMFVPVFRPMSAYDAVAQAEGLVELVAQHHLHQRDGAEQARAELIIPLVQCQGLHIIGRAEEAAVTAQACMGKRLNACQIARIMGFDLFKHAC